MPFLALKLDAACAGALCAAFPGIKRPERLHLTLIHVPDQGAPWPPPNREALELRWQAHGGKLVAPVSRLGRFEMAGGEPLWVLLLGSSALVNLRMLAENCLRLSGIEWSREFLYNPHVTIASGPLLAIADVLPTALTFDRMEWL